MKCFNFIISEKKEDLQCTKSSSIRSCSTTSTDPDVKRSGSEISSLATSDTSADSRRRSRLQSFSQRASNLRVFSVTELKNATKSFSRSVMIGEGGFGCVYRGTIRGSDDPNSKIEIAVKQLGRRGLQGHKEWLTEVTFLGIVEHPNLVKLIGYCAEEDERGPQRLLIYEYMPNRSVGDHLLARSTMPLSWPMRLRIALDAARGLSYLHEGMDFQIIFRDLKTSNILLDEQWNAKLSDFGLAREGPEEGSTHVSTAVVGTLGYAAPEYMHTGRLTVKSDIWSFGVVLYELITGRSPIDRNRPKNEQKLLEWVKPYISDIKKFRMIIDPRLDVRSSLKSAMRLSTVANRCLVRQAKLRPRMTEVMEMLQRIVDGTLNGAPQPPLKPVGLQEEGFEESKKKGLDLKRRLSELKMGEGKRLVWRRWTPKLVKTH
ncbi:probable serine/threonine-protein kinase PBL19 [Phalaenopsis equestris]|uniref:probable serine/threonine-protein kinase PBL19 n=1 Tax=Phalaenopsis equestris TaxID=78828 RepID=UPI0009E541AA|nr:probable serine/threonine-protein kinase PBL19 [Phalaenopsis equestris]XP_020593834.1 probable serine/threonine-protein kinase PBL19 [Phalaenopsis equestris]